MIMFYDSFFERTIYFCKCVFKYLEMAYEMRDFNTSLVLLLSYASDMSEFSQSFSYSARITKTHVLFKRILIYKPKIGPAPASLGTF